MKLIVQVPCYNEEATIARVLEDIPKKIEGIDEIKIVVLDDGSSDKTSEIAEKYGAEVLKSNTNKGLSYTFKKGVQKALFEKADILVNIDGDNQYLASDIKKLVEPILKGRCDIVIGSRPIDDIETFSIFKKFLQKLGTFIVKIVSKADVKDAASGFRAFSKNALLHLNIFNSFTYTIESIIQAKIKNLKIESVPIAINPQKGRKSKLFKNNFDYIFKQAKNTIRFFIIYRPFRFFSLIASILFVLGLIPALRFLFFFMIGLKQGHVQSLILSAIILILSFLIFMIAILADLFSINRKLLEDIQYELRKERYEQKQ